MTIVADLFQQGASKIGLKRTLTDMSNSLDTNLGQGNTKRSKHGYSKAKFGAPQLNNTNISDVDKAGRKDPLAQCMEAAKAALPRFGIEEKSKELSYKYPCDAEDWKTGNPAESIFYCGDIVENNLQSENEHPIDPNYMKSVQTDIKPRMRCILYTWMVEVHAKFKLKEASLWTAFSVCDRYLAKVDVHRSKLQLVGSCCLWIACKYQEIYPPAAVDFVYIADNSFSRERLISAELGVCRALDYRFTVATVHTFLHRFIKNGIFSVKSQRHKDRVKWLTHYACERSVLVYSMLKYRPSEIAAGSLFCALHLTGHKWTEELAKMSGYKVKDLEKVARDIRRVILDFENKAHKAVIAKYSSKSRGAVALLRRKTTSADITKAQAKLLRQASTR